MPPIVSLVNNILYNIYLILYSPTHTARTLILN